MNGVNEWCIRFPDMVCLSSLYIYIVYILVLNGSAVSAYSDLYSAVLINGWSQYVWYIFLVSNQLWGLNGCDHHQ